MTLNFVVVVVNKLVLLEYCKFYFSFLCFVGGVLMLL